MGLVGVQEVRAAYSCGVRQDGRRKGLVMGCLLWKSKIAKMQIRDSKKGPCGPLSVNSVQVLRCYEDLRVFFAVFNDGASHPDGQVFGVQPQIGRYGEGAVMYHVVGVVRQPPFLHVVFSFGGLAAPSFFLLLGFLVIPSFTFGGAFGRCIVVQDFVIDRFFLILPIPFLSSLKSFLLRHNILLCDHFADIRKKVFAKSGCLGLMLESLALKG
jgi:hypothetical protein